MNLPKPISTDGEVAILSPLESTFEDLYINVRKAENRILSDDEVASLPHLPSRHQHALEWQLRQASTNMVVDHMKGTRIENALDLGCGNGWFSNKLTSIAEHVLGVDMNLEELRQAQRVFGSSELTFAFGDIFTIDLQSEGFDLITVNACIQYFPEPKKLISRLLNLLKTEGKIHIIDSPFYRSEEVESAASRSQAYYSQLGFEEMAAHYFQHSWKDLELFNFRVMFDPKTAANRLKRKLGATQPAFPWIIISK